MVTHTSFKKKKNQERLPAQTLGTNLPDDDRSHSVPCVGRNHAHTHTHTPTSQDEHFFSLPWQRAHPTLPAHAHSSSIFSAQALQHNLRRQFYSPLSFFFPQLSCVRAQIRLKQVMKHLPLSRLTVFVYARPWSVDDGQIREIYNSKEAKITGGRQRREEERCVSEGEFPAGRTM